MDIEKCVVDEQHVKYCMVDGLRLYTYIFSLVFILIPQVIEVYFIVCIQHTYICTYSSDLLNKLHCCEYIKKSIYYFWNICCHLIVYSLTFNNYLQQMYNCIIRRTNHSFIFKLITKFLFNTFLKDFVTRWSLKNCMSNQWDLHFCAIL